MNDATKLAIAILVVLACGLTLICYGAGITDTRVGAMVSGVAITWAALALFAAIWRSR